MIAYRTLSKKLTFTAARQCKSNRECLPRQLTLNYPFTNGPPRSHQNQSTETIRPRHYYDIEEENSFADISSPSTSLPKFVTERLMHIKEDVIDYLLDNEAPSVGPLIENSINFTKNLQEMAQYYFSQGGKLIRPTISLLISSACNQSRNRIPPTEAVSLNQYRIAIISEMIHTASLVHDDVIDQSDLRRGHPTANARWGNRQAVLVGDFILARATKVLCMIGKPKVISTMAEIVEDLVKGELMQIASPEHLCPLARFQHYMLKNYYKTGSLFSNSCKSAAILSECDEKIQRIATEFGRNLGIAFQVIDDVLDYVSTSSDLGKPTANDLKLGLATCPVLYAAEEFSELNMLINRRFSNIDDVYLAYELVLKSQGLKRSRELANQHINTAIGLAQKLPNDGMVRDCLVQIAVNINNRNN